MLSTFLVLLRNELRTLLRARISLFWTFAFPLIFLMMMMISYGTRGAFGSVNIEVLDLDQTSVSRTYLDAVRKAFAAGDPIAGTVTLAIPNRPPKRDVMRVTIPTGFGSAVERRVATRVEVAYDFAAGLPTQVAAKVFKPLTIRFNANATGAPMLAALEFRNLGLREPTPFSLYMLTGILVMSMMTAGMNSTCNAIAEMRQRNIFKFMSLLPMRPTSYLGALLGARLIMILLASHVLLFVARYVFQLPVPLDAGRLLNTGVVLIFGGTMLIAAGLALSSRMRRVGTAGMVTNFVYLSMMFACDLTMPLTSLSESARAWLVLLPVSQFVIALRATLLDGSSLMALSHAFLLITAWTICFLLIARLFFFWHKN